MTVKWAIPDNYIENVILSVLSQEKTLNSLCSSRTYVNRHFSTLLKEHSTMDDGVYHGVDPLSAPDIAEGRG